VEPFLGDRLADRPHLGCANLVGVCRERGIPVRLVAGQSRYLSTMFREDGDEFWHLLMSLGDQELARMGLTPFRDGLRERGLPDLERELQSLYESVFVSCDPRRALDGVATETLDSYHAAFCRVYAHVLNTRPSVQLRLVERYVQAILGCDPRFVGFSLQSGFDPVSRAVRRRLREESEVALIVGGPLTPFLPSKEYATLFEQECFDRLVVGEAEVALPQLLETLSDGAAEDVPNVYRLDGGKVIGRPGPPPNDLDALPFPDYGQADLDAFPLPARVLAVQSARGCTWHRCAFCELHVPFEGRFRPFSVDRFVETIAHLGARHGVRDFALADLEVPPARARRIAEAILSAGLDVRLDLCARLTKGFDDDGLLGLLHRAGVRAVEWGLESGCQRVLGLMDKGTQVPVMSRVLRKSAAHGIANLCFVIVGFPGESREEAEATFAFLHGLRESVARADLGRFTLNRDSPIGREPERWGVSRPSDGVFAVSAGMTPAQAAELEARLRSRLKLAPQEWSSGELACLPPSSLSRLVHFVFQGRGMVSSAEVAARIASDDLGALAVVVPGQVRTADGTLVLHPLAVRESNVVNVRHPAPPQRLEAPVAAAVERADGSLTLGEICAVVDRLPPDDAAVPDVAVGSVRGARQTGTGPIGDGAVTPRDRCRAALVSLLASGHAVAFTETWAATGASAGGPRAQPALPAVEG